MIPKFMDFRFAEPRIEQQFVKARVFMIESHAISSKKRAFMNIRIVPLPRRIHSFLSSLPGWRETDISNGRTIAVHAHNFFAMYFVFGVKFLQTVNGSLRLPRAAMVFVPRGVSHGWSATEKDAPAVVGHYHRGHAEHLLLN